MPRSHTMTTMTATTNHTISSEDENQTRAMSQAGSTAFPSRRALWAGRISSGLAVLFLLFDATVKLLVLPVAVQATTQLGYPAGVVFGLGMLELLCLIVYLVPRSSVLGAVLFTGYLGGAIASHLRLSDPLFSHT